MGRRSRRSSPFSLFSFQDIVTSVTAVIILLTLILTLELITRKPTTAGGDVAETANSLRSSIEQLQNEIEDLTARLRIAADSVVEFARSSELRVEQDISATRDQINNLRQEVPLLQRRAHEAKISEDAALARELEREPDRKRLEQFKARAKSLREQTEEMKNANYLVYNRTPDVAKQPWLLDISARKVTATPLGRPKETTELMGSAGALAERVRKWSSSRSNDRDYFAFLVRPSGIELFEKLQEHFETRGFEFGIDLIGEDQKVMDSSQGGTIP